VLANTAALNRRERIAVTVASIAPDIDGLGVIPEIITRNSAHPLLWFSEYHHALHTLWFATVVALLATTVATHKWKTAGLAFLAFHLHLLCDLAGSRGPDGYTWPAVPGRTVLGARGSGCCGDDQGPVVADEATHQ
jgi:hypothetical protein